LGKLDGKETAQMIRYACNPPADNAASIVEEGFPKLGLNPIGARSPLAGFGITISKEMADIPGRILPPPTLSYRVGKPNVKDGGWNILDVKFHRGASLEPSWAVLVVRDGGRDVFSNARDPKLEDLVRGFSAKLRAAGINVPNNPPKMLWTDMLPPPRDDPGRRAALTQIAETVKKNLDPKNKPSFILVLLSLEVSTIQF
jgi:eukaryotic translation initiation factor 2C